MNLFEAIVDNYLKNHREDAEAQFAQFRHAATLEEAISRAALCLLDDGKRHSHQYRIPAKALREAQHRLLQRKKEINGCSTFSQLHELVESKIRDIYGIGELTVYDVATRIGIWRGLEPEFIYLHAGTRKGAIAIGFGGNAKILEKADLPKEFKNLTPSEIEDCLCIYKDWLKDVRLYGPISCAPITKNLKGPCRKLRTC